MSRVTVAIDGPAGAGKSTVARELASRLGYAYLDSGAMYRCVALSGLELGKRLDSPQEMGTIAEAIRIDFQPGTPQRVLLNGNDVTDRIRDADVSVGASLVSVHPAVRRAMVARQRALGAGGGVVMEGRDIGTVVFPDAEMKVFLTASSTERARRRTEESHARGNHETDYDSVLRAIEERDHRDRTRADSPLVRADDAVEVVTDGLTPQEIVALLAGWVAGKEA
ncbi:MAG: (d)CMP kinase [Armatimonadaceae bacterium]